MRTSRVAWTLAIAILLVAGFSATAFAGETSPTIVASTSGPQAFFEYLERVEIGGDGAVVVFDVEGREHEVEVDLGGAVAGVQEGLQDDETGLVDLAVLPLAIGAFLKLAGYLLRLGRL